ncbi:MAG TPA: carboxylating nicotinate-nucleotide diphosphorylase [Gammaproteobacteria bacterium]|nr:carboxylating nicotinate-nucleotide diphosphorylase [Gammaproteobacteria bacterium]
MQDAQIENTVRQALEEDIGSGDVTARLIPEGQQAAAQVICREHAVICGRAWFDEVFRQLDPALTVSWEVQDGDAVTPGQVLCALHGNCRALLTGERTALNFLQTLSGTATRARQFHERVQDLGVTVLDTRKTLPGLRREQKYAVRCGGCSNHRAGLYDAILIKENHVQACGSVGEAILQARRAAPGLPVEVEVENLAEMTEALAQNADIVLLDNFPEEELRRAVQLNKGQARLEASGGITLENIRAIASTGVDFISVGTLTKDLRATDLSMRIVIDR